MEKLAFESIAQLQSKLTKKEISHSELLDFFIHRFEAHDSVLESSLEIFDKESLLNECNVQGKLFGIPGLIKNNICIKDRTTTCASKMLENFQATYDATVVTRLKDTGACMLGTANMDEFAMGSSTETSAYKKTKNPWDHTRVPGGSSGGSAAAVAAGLVPWSLGSDTGGSVRQPAAFCGIVGFKPTYGLVSRYGLISYGSSLDQIGTLTRIVQDSALLLSEIAGHDLKDSSSLAVEKKDYTQHLTGSLPADLRIGIVENALNAQGMDPEIVQAINTAISVLEKLGAKAKRLTMPTMDYSAAAYFILSRAEAASNLARFDGVRYGLRNKKARSVADMYFNTRHDGFGSEVKSRILIGNYVLSSGHAGEFYSNAKKVQRIIRREFIEAFRDVDLLIIPTHPAAAFKFGAFNVDKLQMDLQDYFTCPMNLAGIPAISLPCGMTKDNMPIGFQIVGPHLSEGLIFQTAHAYEQHTQWHTMHPKDY